MASLPSPVVWSMNICSSVGLILANKQVLTVNNFRFATTLTAFHFCMTAIIGFVSSLMGLTSSKEVPFWTLFWFSIVADTSIVSMNLSLMLNTVGFYQIAKLSIIPTCCLVEAILNGKAFSRQVKISVIVVMLGVGVCTVTDVTVKLLGFLSAVVAVISTTLQQVYIGSLQKKYSVGAFDLLSKTAPIQAACLILLGPFLDYAFSGKSLLEYPFTTSAVASILLSCFLALFVNLSTYLCIGKFSAVTFQVLGHMKTIVILSLGWYVFKEELTPQKLAGMGLAIIGMIMYSWAIEGDKARAAARSAELPDPKENSSSPQLAKAL